jgi:deazaflavin-dependent oxidoreductase (nitroreductase family)
LSEIKQPRFKMGALLSRVHRFLYILLNGRFVSHRGSVNFLLLTTKGRRTQRMRTVPLLYFMDGENLCVIGSRGGHPKAPDWVLNIRNNPKVRVQVKGLRREGTAKIATGDEREALWPRFVQSYAGYEAYQARTTRRFPIVVITPSNA